MNYCPTCLRKTKGFDPEKTKQEIEDLYSLFDLSGDRKYYFKAKYLEKKVDEYEKREWEQVVEGEK